MRNRKASASIKSFLCLLLLILCVPAIRAQGDAEKTYKAKCAACHGLDGVGDTAVGKKVGSRDFHSPDVQKETDAELGDIIAKGKNKMPPYEKTMKQDDIKDLASYVRALGAKK